MKATYRIFSVLFTAAAIVGLASCDIHVDTDKLDYPDRFEQTAGKPTVYGIQYTSGVRTEQAFMEEVVCILGENLRSINRIFFNDQEAVLNTSFMTDNTLLVAVPKTMPVVETDKIYLLNRNEETTEYPFRVLPPAPRVSSMSFEYAEPGDIITIYGEYFYQKAGSTPLSVEFSGAEVTDIKSFDFNSITLTIPEGAQPGKVKVTTASGTSASNFMYKDNRGLLFDFDGTNELYTKNKGWHEMVIDSEGGFSGNYLKLGNGTDMLNGDGTDWPDGAYHFEYWAGLYKELEDYGTGDGRRLIDIVDFSDFMNMAVKFEICISEDTPWMGTPMQIIFAGVDLVSNNAAGSVDIYDVELGGQNNTYFHDEKISLPRYLWEPWKETGSYDTGGKWRTVTIPIADFTSYWDGTKAKGTLNKESFSNLEIFVAAGDGSGKPSSPVMKIDNIRAVPAK